MLGHPARLPAKRLDPWTLIVLPLASLSLAERPASHPDSAPQGAQSHP